MRTMGLREMARATGLSVGEIAAARGIGLYCQRIAQGLKPRNKTTGFKESMPSHKDPKPRAKRHKHGTPGTYRLMMEALGRGDEVNVGSTGPPEKFGRRKRMRLDRIKRKARKKK